MKENLYAKFYDVISDFDGGKIPFSDSVQLCENVALKFAKGFGEWTDKNEWYLYDSNLHVWHKRPIIESKTTDELITLYQQSLTPTNENVLNPHT